MKHDAPIKCIKAIPQMNMVATGSWDKTIKFWDCRTPQAQMTLQLPERVYSMSIQGMLMVVATADRKISIYNLQSLPNVYRQLDSPLKYQTRVVSCFPDQQGFCVGSIEGRVAVHHVDQAQSQRNFAFKCHRVSTQKNNRNAPSEVFAVNAIAFHPHHGTFATVGGDGTFNFWDKDNRQRLKTFGRRKAAISCGTFNAKGDIFAYAESYDWGKGRAYCPPAAPDSNKVVLHYTPDTEIRKGKKK